jgi:phage virion morphogenesis protein
MAGEFISVKVSGEKEIAKLLRKLIDRGQSLEPAFAEIGEYLIESHQERFKLEVAPDGTPWEPLSPRTISAKDGDDRILQQSGILRDTLTYQILGDELQFGTDKEYSATHHFGREADGIPARPHIGLATGQWDDLDEITEILQSHLLDNI